VQLVSKTLKKQSSIKTYTAEQNPQRKLGEAQKVGQHERGKEIGAKKMSNTPA